MIKPADSFQQNRGSKPKALSWELFTSSSPTERIISLWFKSPKLKSFLVKKISGKCKYHVHQNFKGKMYTSTDRNDISVLGILLMMRLKTISLLTDLKLPACPFQDDQRR